MEPRNLLATIPYAVPLGTAGIQNFGGSLGMDFTVTSPITVTNLGAFDSNSDGINGIINVRLYDRNNTAVPLASAAFTGAAQQLVGGSRFSPIAGLDLPAGFLGRIVADGYNAAELNGNAGGQPLVWTTNGGGALTFSGGGFFGAAGDYPASGDGGPANRYAAGTFAFVPTPVTTAYVDDSFAGAPGTIIVDADLGTTGDQNAVLGVDAFTTIAAAQVALAGAGTIIVNGGTYAEAVVLAGTQTIDITGPNLAQSVTFNSLTSAAGQTVVLEGTSTLTIGDATNTTVAGVISGSGNLVKQGGSTVILSGANLYTGTTTINGGALSIAADNNLGTAPGVFTAGQLVLNGGTLALSGAGAFTLGGTRGVTVGAGGGTFALNTRPLTYAGRVDGAGNTLSLGGSDTIFTNTTGVASSANFNITSSRLFFNSNNALGTGSINVAAGAGLHNNSGSTASSVTNAIALASTANLATRSQPTTFTNVTLPTTGSVRFNRDDQPTVGLTLSQGVNLTGNLTIEVGGQNATVGATTINGVIGGGFGITKSQPGTLVLAGANTFTGTTTVSAGILTAANATALGTTANGTVVSSGATLGLTGGVAIGAESITAAGAGVGGLGAIRNFAGANSLGGTITMQPATSPIALQMPTAFFSQAGFSPAAMIDGNLAVSVGGWANSGNALGNDAVFETTTNLNPAGIPTTIDFSIFSGGYGNHTIGRFKLYATTDDRSLFADGLINGGDVTATWVDLTPTLATSVNATTLTILGDNSVRASGTDPSTDTFSIRTTTSLANITGFRIETIKDPMLPSNGPGRAPNGNYVIIEWNLSATPQTADVTIASDAGTLTLNGPVNNPGAAGTVSFAGAGNITLAAGSGVVQASGATGVSKAGTGTVTNSGAVNNFSGVLSVLQGVYTAAHGSALGTAAGATLVNAGGTLALSGGLTIAGETFTLSGNGAAGASGALVNQSGNNNLAASSQVFAAPGATQVSIGSSAGVLTVNAPFNLHNAALVVNGAGDTQLLGAVTATTPTQPSLAYLNSLATGNYAFQTDGRVINARVDNDGANSWLLIGRGRQGWEFDVDGQGDPASVNSGLGTNGAFVPAAYSNQLVNDLLAQSGLSLQNVEVRIKRAANAAGTSYQEARWRNFTPSQWTWVFSNPGVGVTSGGLSPITSEIVSTGGAPGAIVGTNAAANTLDFDLAANNSGGRIFTWAWASHAGQRGFSYGSAVNLATGPSTTNFLWESAAENHEIPYTEVYIRSLATPAPADNSLTKNGAGTLTLGGANTYAGTTTVNGGVVVVASNTALGAAAAGTVVNAGQLLFAGNLNYAAAEQITVNPFGGGSVGNQSGTNTFAGHISVLVAPNGATTGVFTGGDLGEGLDLDGSFHVAVNARGPGAFQVRDALFTDQANLQNATITAQNEILNWQNPNFGATANDDNLEVVMQSIRWSANPNTVNVALNNLTAGRSYKVQMLFYEPGNPGRGFDIFLDGNLLVDNYTAGVGGTNGAVVTVQFNATAATHNLTLNGAATPFADKNPVLQAVTVENQGPLNLALLGGSLTLTGQVDGQQAGIVVSGPGSANLNGPVIGTSANSTFTMNGTGAVTLAGANTYAGATNVNSGSLIAAHSSALGGASGGTEVQEGASLSLTGGITIAGESLTIRPSAAAGNDHLINAAGANAWNGPIQWAVPAPLTTRGLFTGGDAGEGLDLTGTFPYAINFGGTPAGPVQGVTFTSTEGAGTPGLTFAAPSALPAWFAPDYGVSGNDNALESITQSIRHGGVNPGQVSFTLSNLVPGNRYKLQLLVDELTGYTPRGFDVYIEGQPVATNYNTSASNAVAVGGVITHEFTALRDRVSVSLQGATASGFTDRNPVLNAVTLELMTPAAPVNMRIRSDAGQLTLGGTVTVGAALGDLRVSGAGNVIANGAIIPQNYQGAVASLSPLNYWRLNDATLPVAVDSAGTRNGTFVNVPAGNLNQAGAFPGQVNTAVQFNTNVAVDQNRYVSIPSDAALNATLQGDYTAQFWMYKDGESADWQRLFGKGADPNRTFGIWEEAGAARGILYQVYTTGGGVNLTSTDQVPVGQWTHVVATKQGSTISLYINGRLNGTATLPGTPLLDANPLTIGRAPTLHRDLPGRMDEVALFGTALSASQVAGLYAAGAATYTTGLVKESAGTLTLAGTNSYTGTTNVNGGTVVLQNGAAILDTAGPVSVANGATLQLNASETVSAFSGAATSTLVLAGNTLTANTANVLIGNVTTANGGITAVAGAIVDNNIAAANITGTGIVLQSATGVGSTADPIEAAISGLEATGGAGGVFLTNTGGLTIGGLSAVLGISAGGGDIVIRTAGSLTINENIAAAGAGNDVALTTVDAAGVGQDFVVSGGVTVSSASASVTLNSGDNATISGNVTSGTTTTINIDATSGGVVDAGVGGSLIISGVITTPTVGAGGGTFVNGFTDNDTFTFNPQTTTEFRLLGDLPTGVLTGDTLVMNVSGTTNPNLTVPGTLAPYNGLGSGAWSFTSAHRPVLFGSIEQSTITGNYHVTFDNSVAPVANLVVMRDSALPTANVQLRDGSTGGAIVYQGTMSTMLSLRILGSVGNDTVTIDDINTLPDFSGTVPGVTDNANAAGTAELLFDGLGGNDTLVFNINGATASQTYAIGNGTGAAGLEGEIQSIAAGVTLQTYFQNVELTQRAGAGATPGGMTIIGDASDNNFSTAANIAATRTTITGYTPFEFSGNNYSALTINALAGDDSLDLVSLGTNQTNNPAITLSGGTDDDTLRVRSTSGNTGSVTLIGDAGSDLFQLFDANSTVDNIAGPVIVDGSDGNIGSTTDTLLIVDSGDLTADPNVAIFAVSPGTSQDYAVEGINGASGHDVTFRNIDVLDYTGTAADDQIDGRFESTASPHDLNTIILSGWTGADQFLLYTSDQIGGTGAFNTPTGTASGIANINLYGDAPSNPNAGDGNDIFGITPPGLSGTGAMNVGLVVLDSIRMIRPSASTAIAIDGGRPTGLAAPLGDVTGDVLNVNISQLPNATPVIVSTFAPGTVVAGGIEPLTWVEIEDINVVDQGKLTNVQMGDLFARTTPGPDLVQITLNPTALNPHQVRLRITATIGNYSASNKTIVYGGAMNDTITQANLTIPAEFYGEDGNDYLSGAMNNDWLVGGLGNDRINGSGGDNVIWGDNAPTIPGDLTPQDGLAGGDDTLSGLSGNDVFYGGAGNDLVSAGGGNDYAYGGEGDDTLDGHAGDDRLYGGNGNDVLSGFAGHDLLSGGDGDDRLYGDAGNDVLFGGFGSDLVDGGVGDDLLVSGRVAIESSSWTSVASTSTYSAATYTQPGDNDAALLTLLTQWATLGNRGTLGTSPAITHDGVNDDLWGGTGDDDFCWETADVLDNFPGLTPPDFNAPSMGTDVRFGPT